LPKGSIRSKSRSAVKNFKKNCKLLIQFKGCGITVRRISELEYAESVIAGGKKEESTKDGLTGADFCFWTGNNSACKL
ncbi:MAG TPA: hypothetical protein DCZ80_05740, partial [Legionellales bacterium]|nr:hypothetical protein [Legionellales bacterium]